MTAPLPTCLGSPSWIDGHRLPTGAPDPTVYVWLAAAGPPPSGPATGLSSATPHEAYYLGAEDRRPSVLELAPGPSSEGRCGFWEVDRDLMPGLYGLQVPHYARRQGHSYLRLHFAATRPHILVVQGVGYDPYERFSIGLDNWKEHCHGQLRGGLRRSMPPLLRPFLEEWSAYHHPSEDVCSSR